MYCLIECLIREYQPTMKRIYIVSLVLLIAVIQALLHKYSTQTYVDNCYNLGCVIITSLIFLLFYDLKAKKKNCLCKIFRQIADISFSFFLIQYFFEQLFYFDTFAKKGYNTFMKRLPHLFYAVPVAVVGGVACSLVTHLLSVYIMKILDYIIYKFKECYKAKEKELELNSEL